MTIIAKWEDSFGNLHYAEGNDIPFAISLLEEVSGESSIPFDSIEFFEAIPLEVKREIRYFYQLKET
jgi:hypothetical protein